MKFNTLKFLQDYNIDHTTNHTHATTDWIQVHCPFCPGKRNYHLGITLKEGNGNCWRCGSHDLGEIIKELSSCTWNEVDKIKSQYSGTNILNPYTGPSPSMEVIRPKKLTLPPGTQRMAYWHKKYLQDRDFSPDKLEQEWDLKGTGWQGDYKFRIIAPIYFKDQLVSYQGRDITGKSKLRYKACASKDEITPHKHLLYGLDKVPGDIVVVVEGITDVWRLGYGAVATFGLTWSKQQLNLLRRFNRVIIWYDEQPQAQAQARKLGNELALLADVVIVRDTKYTTKNNGRKFPVKDPAELLQKDADKFMREYLGR